MSRHKVGPGGGFMYLFHGEGLTTQWVSTQDTGSPILTATQPHAVEIGAEELSSIGYHGSEMGGEQVFRIKLVSY